MAFKHVIVATDFNDCSQAAVEHAIELARTDDAALTVVHAFDLPHRSMSLSLSPLTGELMTALEDQAQVQLEKALVPIRARLPGAKGVVRFGSPGEEILEVAREQGADLIVVGTHGHKSLPRALLGSSAEKVIRLSPIPVLTVHGP